MASDQETARHLSIMRDWACTEAADYFEAMAAERDKLHAALAWMLKAVDDDKVGWNAREIQFAISRTRTDVISHDGTPAGRAAALVRLWERMTGGEQ